MSTSTRIRQFLEVNETSTVEQLSRALDLTKADIHYHIRLLLKQGVLDIHTEPYQNGAGRPARQFFLVKPAPETLSRLIIALLTEFQGENRDKTPQRNDLGIYLASGILDRSCGPVDEQLSPTLRLTRIIRQLSSYGIHLRWLARKDGPFIFAEQEYLSTLIKDPSLVTIIIESLLIGIHKRIA